ncbi:MFS transporter [Pseudomonas grimontii]|jgi:ACS family D-galactonate transporter-like MFS transporter|uniref:D-galactonate transporter n=1 Tax=Pseudomonas grimontii TaxID=129847 RepID=A0A1H1FXI3_9PSED|nr:MFS transporter [Pseudomonas grimontii]MCS3514955.1 D-galactonate transporter [Pseudomonas grimontii]TWR61336.1 MFS transporter [Pseudomonas grimontii]SDR05610.1 D-galactonate transporter [Pseudomonas grimontii]
MSNSHLSPSTAPSVSAGVQDAVLSQRLPTRRRWFMLSLLLIATIINYIDRVNISIAAPFMAKDLGLDKIEMGLIFSAFAWTYALALVPAGFVADRFGSRLTYGVSLISWSTVTVCQGFATGFASLFGLRLAVGAMEAPAFPANSRAVTVWFPARERGVASSIYVCGQYLGTALFTGLLLWLATTYDWRHVFYSTGLLGIVFGVAWLYLYRDPLNCKRVSQEELKYIEAGGGLVKSSQERTRFNWRQIAELFRYRQIWAICIGKFASTSALYFFLTWFPTYLIEERKLTMIKAGIFAVLPFVGATVGILLAGIVSDLLIRRGYSMSFARKLPLVVGSMLGMSIVLVNFTDSNVICIAVLTIAFFAQGIASSSWAAVSEVAPKELIGLTGGITSLAANIGGIVTPIVIGGIVHATGSFAYAFWFIGGVALIGTLSYSLLLGRLFRIELKVR